MLVLRVRLDRRGPVAQVVLQVRLGLLDLVDLRDQQVQPARAAHLGLREALAPLDLVDLLVVQVLLARQDQAVRPVQQEQGVLQGPQVRLDHRGPVVQSEVQDLRDHQGQLVRQAPLDRLDQQVHQGPLGH